MSLDVLREEQPQIFAMLKTEFKAAIIGFEDAITGQMYDSSPPPAANPSGRVSMRCGGDYQV
jgi:hypothetical protein